MFGFGINLGKRDVLVLLSRGLEDRRELFARPAPFGPPVDQQNAFGVDGFFEGGFGQVDGAHVNLSMVITWCNEFGVLTIPERGLRLNHPATGDTRRKRRPKEAPTKTVRASLLVK